MIFDRCLTISEERVNGWYNQMIGREVFVLLWEVIRQKKNQSKWRVGLRKGWWEEEKTIIKLIAGLAYKESVLERI